MENNNTVEIQELWPEPEIREVFQVPQHNLPYLLEQVDIAAHAHKLPSGLSGGEQQRAAIARALANDPPLVVADEPTGNLDTATANEVFELFERLVGEGKTLMVVTHDRNLSTRTERTIRLLDGRIHRDGMTG